MSTFYLSLFIAQLVQHEQEKQILFQPQASHRHAHLNKFHANACIFCAQLVVYLSSKQHMI